MNASWPADLDRIAISGITATGFHGVFEHERRDGQTFVVDIVVGVDTRAAARSDDLALTVDYSSLADQVVLIITGEPVDLIETLAERIAEALLQHDLVRIAEVCVHKPQAPLEVDFTDVTVTIVRSR